MQIYKQTQNAITASKASNKTPVVIFDLDDTLIDCRHRKYLVIQNFIQQEHIKRDFTKECALLTSLDWQKVQYRVLDTLKQEGIDDSQFCELMLRFWRQQYFTYDYLLKDQPFRGALDYVEYCHNAGAIVVYLTGRDEPGMGLGTRDSLQKLGFPVKGPQVEFILKPNPLDPDFEFKVAALEQIDLLGEVIAALENELVNLNAMAARFPEAAVYWRKTLYMPNPPLPHPRVQIIQNFS
ncbi:MAG: HAD family hydrolase [Proteobacteria bacterium]|nr:HAD family hydrolase [Pseudomonadota bacterium]